MQDADEEVSVNTGTNLFVTGIHPRLSESDVARLFEKYGEVESCSIMLDPHTKESRGFGFVKMVTSDQADAAKEGLQGEVIQGRTLSIEKARRARPRTPTPGKYFGPPKRGKSISYVREDGRCLHSQVTSAAAAAVDAAASVIATMIDVVATMVVVATIIEATIAEETTVATTALITVATIEEAIVAARMIMIDEAMAEGAATVMTATVDLLATSIATNLDVMMLMVHLEIDEAAVAAATTIDLVPMIMLLLALMPHHVSSMLVDATMAEKNAMLRAKWCPELLATVLFG